MLELYANGKRLQLPEDVEIELTFENPFLMQDRIPSAYSMSFNLPATRENLQSVGNAKRIAATGVWTGMESSILFNMVNILQGKLLLQETEKDLKFSFVGSLLPDAVKKTMNELLFDRYDFGIETPTLPLANGWSGDYTQAIINSLLNIGEKFAACPVRVKDEEWWGNSGIYNADKLYMNMWNVNDGAFVFNTEEYPVHAAIFPQPYVHYLFETILGGKLNSNFFKDDAELKRLCIVTSFHKSYPIMMSYLPGLNGIILDSYEQNYFYVSSFFNKYLFNDFLKNILKLFCCSLMPRPDGTWDIIHNKVIIENTETVDWSNKLAGIPVIGMQYGQKYEYGYNSETAADEEWASHTVESVDVLMSNSTPEGIYLVSSTGEVYEKKLKTAPAVYTYERKKSGLGGNNNSDEKESDIAVFDMKSEVSPVKMRPDEYWWENTGPALWPWYVPEFSGDRSSDNEVPQIGFMRGFYNVETKQIVAEPEDYSGHYPLLTPYAVDPAGNDIGNYSLAWDGAKGLKTKFHSEYKAYFERDRSTLRALFRLTHLDLKNLDYKKKVYVRGKLFYIKKIETTLKKRSISLCRCELIEA